MNSRVRRPGVEGRHDGLAAARGEERQQPRRRRREDADPGPSTVERRRGQNPMDLEIAQAVEVAVCGSQLHGRRQEWAP